MPSSIEVVNSVRLLFRDGTAPGESDGQLLDRFSRQRDEAAFAILVERHGPMVLRVCRAILDDDARDAFQATFLVLVRRIRWIDRRRSAGPWLFGVARRIAVRARADAARRRARERQAAEVRLRTDEPPAESWTELYEELARLPAKYRDPLVLCHLEGCTTEQAAARLGCPRGTILSRLARGREQLKARLIRRGLAPIAALIAADRLAVPNVTAVSPALSDATVKAASQAPVGTAVAAAGLVGVKAGLAVATIGGLVAGAFALASPQAAPSRAAAPKVARKAEASNALAFIARPIDSLPLRGHKTTIFCAAFSPRGDVLATGDASGTLKLWDVATGRESASAIIKPHQEHRTQAAIMALDFSPDGKTLAMGCDDMTIRLRDVATREETLVLPRPYFPNTVKFSPDGATLAWAASNAGVPYDPKGDKLPFVVVLWDVAGRRERAVLAGHAEGIDRVTFAPDGATLASASRDGVVRLWDPATGAEREVLKQQASQIFGLTFSPDGRTLVVSGSDQRAAIDHSDIHSQSSRGRLTVCRLGAQPREWSTASVDYSMNVAFSPDGRYLAASGHGGQITILDAATQVERASLAGGETFLYGLAFSPDGKTLATAGRAAGGGGGGRLWRIGGLLESLGKPSR